MGRLGTAEMSLGPVLHLRGALQDAGQDHVPAGGAHHHHHHLDVKPTYCEWDIVFVDLGYLLYYFQLVLLN